MRWPGSRYGVRLADYAASRFGGSRISQYQFAFLSLLAEQCRLASPVMVYDPMLDVNERAYLEEVGFVNVARNEEGWRPVTRPTLFFMPHCGRALYKYVAMIGCDTRPRCDSLTPPLSNVVGSNAHDLSRICIMGNRLDRYLEMDDEDGDSCFLREVRGAWVTDPCPAAFDDEDCAFNDFALQWFPSPDAVDRAPRSMPVTTSSNIIKTWQVAC